MMIIKYNILRSSQSSIDFYCLMESNNNKILHSKMIYTNLYVIFQLLHQLKIHF